MEKKNIVCPFVAGQPGGQVGCVGLGQVRAAASGRSGFRAFAADSPSHVTERGAEVERHSGMQLQEEAGCTREAVKGC